MKIINLTELPHYADVISQWHYNEWGKLYPDESQNDFYNELIQSLKEDNISSTWLLLNGNKVIGSASILEIDLITPENFNPWLGNIYILPSYRGKGLGRNFVREVMKKIQDSGIENLYLYTEDKTQFYENLGWEIMRQENLEGFSITIMCVSLQSAVSN